MPDAGRIRTPLAPFSLIVAGITLVGLALRLPLLGDSLTRDEVGTYTDVVGHDLGAVIDLVRSNYEGTPPLFFVLAWMTKGIGSTPQGLGLTSLVAGVAAIPLVYLLGLRTVGRRAGTVGAALVALSPFLIFYSTEARAYSLLMALVLLSTLCLLEALQDGRLRWWIGYGGFSVLAMYTHYFAAFVLVGQLAWALWAHREAWRGLAAANLGAAIGYLPWVPGYLDDRNAPAASIIEAIRPFGFSTVRDEVYHWLLLQPGLPGRDVPGNPALWAIVAGLTLGAGGLIARLVEGRRGRAQTHAAELPEAAGGRPHWRCASARPPSGLVLVIVLALAMPVGAVLYSLHWPSIYVSRSLIASWPGLALCVGALLTAGRRWLAIPAVGLVLVGFAVGATRSLYSEYRMPDYDAAAAFIEAAGPPGAPVVQMPAVLQIESSGPFTALEAAFGVPTSSASREHPILVLDRAPLAQRVAQLESAVPLNLLAPPSPTPPDEIARQARRRAAGGNLFLVVGSDTPLPLLYLDPGLTGQFLRALYGGFVPVARRSFDGVWPLTVWVLRPRRG